MIRCRYEVYHKGEFDHEQVGTVAHTDHLRDIKVCPSLFTKETLLVSAGDDKKIVVWKWIDGEITLHWKLDLGKSISRIAWNFTGKYLYGATAEGPVTMVLDKEASTLSVVNN